jgi:hypothetical protein
VLAGHGDSHMLGADRFVVGRVIAKPPPAGNINFGPGVGGAVLAFTHLDIPSDKSGPKPPVARRFHHEHRKIPARPGAQKERPARKLDSGLLAANIFERLINMRIQLAQEFRSPDELAGLIKVQEPVLHGWTVMRIAGETILDDLYLLVCSVLKWKAIGTGVDQAFDGFIIVKIHINLTEQK